MKLRYNLEISNDFVMKNKSKNFFDYKTNNKLKNVDINRN